MNIQEAKKIIEKGIKPEYERLRQYEGYKYTGGWLEAIETVLNELDKKDKIINDMAEQMAGLTIWNNEKEEPLILMDKQEVIKYFTNKYEEGKGQ